MDMPLFAWSPATVVARGKAARIVQETLTAVLPPGVPPSYREIISARVEGTGRRQEIVAELMMIDGLPASVRLKRWSMGWSHRYISMPGGALSWEGGRWLRVPEPDESTA